MLVCRLSFEMFCISYLTVTFLAATFDLKLKQKQKVNAFAAFAFLSIRV